MTPRENLLMAIIREAVDNLNYEGWVNRDRVNARNDAREFLFGSELDKTRLEDFIDFWHLPLNADWIRQTVRKGMICR